VLLLLVGVAVALRALLWFILFAKACLEHTCLVSDFVQKTTVAMLDISLLRLFINFQACLDKEMGYDFEVDHLIRYINQCFLSKKMYYICNTSIC